MKAIYDEIYRNLLGKIERGEYPYQTYIPSEANLIKEYSCSHNTLRKAIALLTQQGALQPVHGKGVRVIYQKRPRALFELGGIETFQEASKRNQLDTETRVLKFERIVADKDLARYTGFDEGDELLYVIRVRIVGGKASILDCNYFRASLVPGLTPDIAQFSIYDYIEKTLNMQIATSKRTVTVERVTREDQDCLDLDGADYLAVVTGQTFNFQGERFEFTQSKHRPDYFSFFTVARREI